MFEPAIVPCRCFQGRPNNLLSKQFPEVLNLTNVLCTAVLLHFSARLICLFK